MTKWDWIGVHALSGGIIGGYSAAFLAAGPIGQIALGVSIVAISTADMIPAINELKEVGVTWCTVTRVVFDVAGLAFGAMGIVNGVRAWRAGGSILYWADSYPAITPPTNRAGLRATMGNPPDEFINPHAHHNLPWTFRNWFAGEGRGLNVNDPNYGRWVEGTQPGPHQTWSQLYEQEWATFIDKNPNATRPQVLAFLNKLLSSGKYPSK